MLFGSIVQDQPNGAELCLLNHLACIHACSWLMRVLVQVIKVQKNMLAEIQGQAQEQILTGQRELSRGVLAPTIQVGDISCFSFGQVVLT